jgi:hypothetical protein
MVIETGQKLMKFQEKNVHKYARMMLIPSHLEQHKFNQIIHKLHTM